MKLGLLVRHKILHKIKKYQISKHKTLNTNRYDLADKKTYIQFGLADNAYGRNNTIS